MSAVLTKPCSLCGGAGRFDDVPCPRCDGTAQQPRHPSVGRDSATIIDNWLAGVLAEVRGSERSKLSVTGKLIGEDSAYWWTEEDGALCRWAKAWYHG